MAKTCPFCASELPAQESLVCPACHGHVGVVHELQARIDKLEHTVATLDKGGAPDAGRSVEESQANGAGPQSPHWLTYIGISVVLGIFTGAAYWMYWTTFDSAIERAATAAGIVIAPTTALVLGIRYAGIQWTGYLMLGVAAGIGVGFAEFVEHGSVFGVDAVGSTIFLSIGCVVAGVIGSAVGGFWRNRTQTVPLVQSLREQLGDLDMAAALKFIKSKSSVALIAAVVEVVGGGTVLIRSDGFKDDCSVRRGSPRRPTNGSQQKLVWT